VPRGAASAPGTRAVGEHGRKNELKQDRSYCVEN